MLLRFFALLLFFSSPYNGAYGDNSKTEAGAICTKPSCYNLSPDATAEQIAKLCYKTLPAICQELEVDIKETQCYAYKGEIKVINAGAESFFFGIKKAAIKTAEGLGGVFESSVEYIGDFVTDSKVRKEAKDTTSYLYYQIVEDPIARAALVRAAA